MTGPDKKPSPPEEHLDALERRFHEGEAAGPELAPASPPGGGEAAPEGRAQAGDDPDDLDMAALRATHLGRRLARRRGHALVSRERRPVRLFGSWALAALALLGSWGFAGTVPELRYWLSSAQPIDLGRMGAYRLEGVPDGAYVKVEGIASPKRGTWSRMLGEHELFPLVASRILVDRARAPDPALKGFGFRYAGEGRLTWARPEGRWAGVREQFEKAGELGREGAVAVIEDGVAPWRGWRTPLESGAWALLVVACVAVLSRRALRSRAPSPPDGLR